MKRGGESEGPLQWCTEGDVEEWLREEFSHRGEAELWRRLQAVLSECNTAGWRSEWQEAVQEAREQLGVEQASSQEQPLGVFGKKLAEEGSAEEDSEEEGSAEEAVLFNEAMYDKYWDRYDLDGAGVIGATREELYCLTANLVTAHKLPLPGSVLDHAVDTACDNTQGQEYWSKEEFRAWFVRAFLSEDSDAADDDVSKAPGSEGSEATEKLADEKLCVICLDRPKTHVFTACFHKCVCEHCAADIKHKLVKTCPMCRMNSVVVRRVYE